MTEYRAVLQTHKKQERPVQSISYSLSTIENWILITLTKNPEGEIILYKNEEREIGRFVGPEKVKSIASRDCSNCMHPRVLHLLTCKTSDQIYGACAHLNCTCAMYQPYAEWSSLRESTNE